MLRGETLVAPMDAFEIQRSLPHGHVAATLGKLRRLGVETLIDRRASRERSFAVAMVVARVVEPRSKLATAQGTGDETAFNSLGEELQVVSATEDELYLAMDWLLARQARIENALAKRHLQSGTHVLYDVSSAYFEGRTCPPAKRSPAAEQKAGEKRTEDDFPVHSFQTLLRDLATLTKNYVQAKIEGAPLFVQYSKPTRLQARVFELLKVAPEKP